jgi:3-oxoacyl-[acyl-carrier protein] reductase
MRALAVELAPYQITANCVAPGLVDTVRGVSSGAQPATLIDTAIPLRRKATPDDIAATIRHLVGPEGGYVTGQTIHVNGGLFLT